jgi:hypothetical protein
VFEYLNGGFKVVGKGKPAGTCRRIARVRNVQGD